MGCILKGGGGLYSRVTVGCAVGRRFGLAHGAQTEVIVRAEWRTADTTQRPATVGCRRDATGGGAGALRYLD